MIIYPAIDLRNGKCVRLYQGDYTRETVYGFDPFLIAEKFMQAGAGWLHLVDLDAAKLPEQSQLSLITQLIKFCGNGISVQVGGGMRTTKQIEKMLEGGAARVVVGSKAVTSSEEVKRWLQLFGSEKIVLSFDIVYDENKLPVVTTNAWQNITKILLFNLIEDYFEFGLQQVLCTNVTLDGTLNGPDYILYEAVLKRFPRLNLQASGGVSSMADIKLLREKNLSGVVIGRALYENKFTLQEALSC